jgi:hypothetical protein
MDEDKVLWIFARKVYPEINPQPERKLIERLRKAIFTDAPRVDARTSLLVSLAKNANLLHIPFAKKELKTRKQRIEQLTNGDLISKATKDAVEAAQAAQAAAVLCTCIIPAVTVTTVTS